MPLDLTRIRALCFDVDGTLSDTDDRMVYQLAHRLELVRWLFPAKDPHPFARWFVMGLEAPGNFIYEVSDWLGLDDHLEFIKKGLSNLMARQGWGRRPPVFWLVPHVHQVLDQFKARYPMAVVSARDPRGTQAFLEQFDLFPYFRAVAHAQTCRHTKPFPDPILWAAAKMDVTPEQCLMIGDTTVDIRAGKAAGAQTVGVLCGFGHETELRHAGADLILPSIHELADLLEGKVQEDSHPTVIEPQAHMPRVHVPGSADVNHSSINDQAIRDP